MNGFALNNIQDCKYGSTQVSALYLGSTLIWPTSPVNPYERMYLTIESLQSNCSFYLELDTDMLGTTGGTATIYYRINGGSWVSYSSGNITLDTNDKAEIKIEYSGWPYKTQTQDITISPVKIYGRTVNLVEPSINIYGNPGSLSWGDDFINHGTNMKAMTFSNGYYWRMQFFGNGRGSSGHWDLINFNVVDRSNLIGTTGWDYITQ